MLVDYDESSDVMTTKGAEHQRLGNMLQEGIRKLSKSQGSRVMRGDNIVPSMVQPIMSRPMGEAETQAGEVEQLDNGTNEDPLPKAEASLTKSPAN